MSLSKLNISNNNSNTNSEITYKNKLILLGGPSCCGKSTLCSQIDQHFSKFNKPRNVVILSMDRYYISTGNPLANYDEPAALDMPRVITDLKQLMRGESIYAPIYDFKTHTTDPHNTTLIDAAPVIILEGIFVLNDPELVELATLKVMIDCEEWILVDRRHTRDSRERGRTPEDISRQLATVMRGKKTFIDPLMKLADIVLHNNDHNKFQGQGVMLPCIQNLIDSDKKLADNPIVVETNDESQSIIKITSLHSTLSPEEYLKTITPEQFKVLQSIICKK